MCRYLCMCKHMSACLLGKTACVSVHQGTGEQSRAHTCPGHHTWPSHLLCLLILHRGPWLGNEPLRVAESPHVMNMIGAYGRVQRAMEDHALWDQRPLCLNYRPGPGPPWCSNCTPGAGADAQGLHTNSTASGSEPRDSKRM